MAVYNIHAGHCPQGKGACGASGLLQESVENRKVKERLIANLRSMENVVYDCTCEEAVTAKVCLQKIVQKCNAHMVDLDISLHLNAGGGTGTEVWCYDEKTAAIAARISRNISAALGIADRGVKYSRSLYVLRHTKSPALLIECCFVDRQKDYERWNAKACADAIAAALTGKNVQQPAHEVAYEVIFNRSYGDASRWMIRDLEDGYITLQNKKTGQYLTLDSLENGTLFTLSQESGSENQRFRLVRKEYKKAVYLMLEPYGAEGKYASVENFGRNGEDHTHLKIWDDLKNGQQKFWLKVASDGTHLIMDCYSTMYLSCKSVPVSGW